MTKKEEYIKENGKTLSTSSINLSNFQFPMFWTPVEKES